MIQLANEKSGFIKAMWCGDLECEMKLKEQAGVTSRCVRPLSREHLRRVRLLRQARQIHGGLGQSLLNKSNGPIHRMGPFCFICSSRPNLGMPV